MTERGSSAGEGCTDRTSVACISPVVELKDSYTQRIYILLSFVLVCFIFCKIVQEICYIVHIVQEVCCIVRNIIQQVF